MRLNKLTAILPILASCLLAGSLLGNLFLFQKAKEFYRREARVRLEPISERYHESNKELLERRSDKPLMIFFGESRAAMWRIRHPESWGDFEIANRGIGAETTPQIRARLAKDVLALNPDVVVLQMGDNDLKTIAVLSETQEATIEATYSNIVEMAQAIADSGAKVVVTTIFPPGPVGLLRRPLWSNEVNEAIDLVNQRLLAFSYANVLVVDCDPVLREGKFIKGDYSLDTLHLNKEGYAALDAGLSEQIGAFLDATGDR